ncbi:MAG: MMPL family transporter [Treponema sp.]|jgi:predicted RND superfamily exporter protein|nr:MMPL family transporter [Treponema sp.]
MEKLFKKPVLVIGVIALITVFFTLQLPRAELDNNNYRFLPETHQARIDMDHIDAAFGSSTLILVGLERPYGTVFEGDFLALIKNYVSQVENIGIVQNVNSIVTTDYITGDDESIIAQPLVDNDFSGAPEEIAELKTRIASWDIFKRSLVSDDQSATQILVSLDVSREEAGRADVIESLVKIRDMAREMFDSTANVYVTGMPVISATINEAMIADLILLIPLFILVVLLVLFISFRRFSMVLLPLLTVAVAVIWTVGAMPLFGVKLSILSTLLPVILVAVGSAYGIHIVSHYADDIQNRALSVQEHRDVVFALMRKIIKPVFFASLTTFAGFLSFCFTSVLPVREFGIFASFGVLACFTVAVSLIPGLILIRGPRRPRRLGAPLTGSSTDPFSEAMADGFLAVAQKKHFVMVVTVALIAVSMYGFSKLIIDNVLVEYFKNTTDISRSDRFIREKFGGSKELSLVVEADSAEALLTPEVLSAIDRLERYLTDRVPAVGKVIGFTDFVKRINQVFNVGQSPEGLQPIAIAESDTGDFGFGGMDTFGFDESTELPSVNDLVSDAADQYSAADLLALLTIAAGTSADMSGNDLVRELQRLVNYEGMSYYEIPVDPKRYGKTEPEALQQLVSNYLILLSGDISDYANDPLEPTSIKTMIQLRTLGQKDSQEVLDQIAAYLDTNLPENTRYLIGGSVLQEDAITNLVLESQFISIPLALLVVFIILSLSHRSIIAGLIGIVPLSITILCNFAVMGFLGIKLNIATSLIGSLTVGIGIDYTIHYLESYKREYRAANGQGDFLRRTFLSSGKAILINAVSVAAGFAVIAFSQFNLLIDLGVLIAFSMLMSALISLTVLPVLLTLIKPRFICRQKA